MNNFTDQEITEMAMDLLSTLEVTPLSHKRKMEVVAEFAIDELGKQAHQSVILLAITKANLGWNELVIKTKAING